MTVNCIGEILKKSPDAVACVKGSEKHPGISGKVRFYSSDCGTVVASEITGLNNCKCQNGFFAFHIHEGKCCTGNSADLFSDAGGHYNPENTLHPCHAGDMPPLLATESGHALNVFITDRFSPCDIIGRTVIIHAGNDDMKSQPSGNSGEKIACGMIKRCE